MQTNINTELFRRYAPKKKIEIIKSLTQEELLAITPKTVTRIVKEAGQGKVSLYIQMDSTDTENTEYYSKFFSGERYRGTCHESDRYGNPNYHYFFYDDEDRANCIKSILLEYVYTKYADKLNPKND